MAQKEQRIDSWQRTAQRAGLPRQTMLTLDHEDNDTAEKPQSRQKESFSPIQGDGLDRAERRLRFQQTHTAKRRNERSQDLYRTHFNEPAGARSAERQGQISGAGVTLGAKKQRNPFIRDVFKSQVLIS